MVKLCDNPVKNYFIEEKFTNLQLLLLHIERLTLYFFREWLKVTAMNQLFLHSQDLNKYFLLH